eukprot:2381451-Rhodomonas_salina.1
MHRRQSAARTRATDENHATDKNTNDTNTNDNNEPTSTAHHSQNSIQRTFLAAESDVEGALRGPCRESDRSVEGEIALARRLRCGLDKRVAKPAPRQRTQTQ